MKQWITAIALTILAMIGTTNSISAPVNKTKYVLEVISARSYGSVRILNIFGTRRLVNGFAQTSFPEAYEIQTTPSPRN